MKPLTSLREDLEGILATKEYKIYTQEHKSFLQNLLDSLKNWLQQILQNLFPHTDVAKKTFDWLAYGLIALGIFLLFLLLFLLLSRFVRHDRIHSKEVRLAMDKPLTTQRQLAEAHKLAEAGDYSSALRILFLGFILYLDQNQRIEAKAWKTNWEYYAELKERTPQLANSFYKLAIKFEEAMYGGRPIAKDDYWFYSNQVSELIHEGDTR